MVAATSRSLNEWIPRIEEATPGAARNDEKMPKLTVTAGSRPGMLMENNIGAAPDQREGVASL
jgi:hypothetical protein